ncbi:XRE family transcriptional regulator [Sphingobium yanoikuyae]|uniref:XRE family transcriptional regulator n=1 Tax=Sphingobium yanoikuyae TaxID=13690 RepID=UPI00345E594C
MEYAFVMRTGERIAARRAELGLSQSELARQAGVSQATIGKLESGISSGSSQMHKIARALQTTPDFLTGETDDPSLGAIPLPTPQMIAEQLGMTLIPEVDLDFALGGGNYVEGPVSSTLVPYRTDWLERITRGAQADVILTRGDGDSMMPTILDDDDVIVNRADRVITKQDRIWALGYGDLVAIKRVRRLASGIFQLISDNPNVSPIEAYEDELRVIGRVIWIGRRM